MTVWRQVVFGRPGFLFPDGVHRKATLGIQTWSILSTWPSHRIRLCLISNPTLWQQVLLYSSLLDILLGQKIQRILRRQCYSHSYPIITTCSSIPNWNSHINKYALYLFSAYVLCNMFSVCITNWKHNILLTELLFFLTVPLKRKKWCQSLKDNWVFPF